MTTDLAVVQQLHNTLDLPERDRGAAEAVATRRRDAKAGNTRRASASAWRQFRTWAEAGGHPALPAAPQAVVLYLGHLASTGRSIATVQQARSAISHFHAAAGTGKGDNPALHPVVSEAVKGWRNRAPAPRQAGALTADALARVREVLRLPKRGRGGRMESADTARRPPPWPGATWSCGPTAPAASPSRRARTRPNRPRWRSPRRQPAPCGISGPTMLTQSPPCSD